MEWQGREACCAPHVPGRASLRRDLDPVHRRVAERLDHARRGYTIP